MGEEQKKECIAKLRKYRLENLANLVEKDIISSRDTVVNFPLNFAAEQHLELKNEIVNYEKVDTYEQTMIEQSKNLIELFEAFYPGVEIGDLVFRQKSAKSIVGKVKNLEVEKISKLLVAEADMPERMKELRKAQLNKIENDKSLTEEQKKWEKKKIELEEKGNIDFLRDLLFERVEECIVQPGNDSENEKSKQEEYKKIIEGLINKNIVIDYNQIDQLLDDDRFSSSTKKAFARILYYRMKTDKEKLITDLDGNITKIEVSEEDRQTSINELHDEKKDELSWDSIVRLERPCPAWKEPIYDGRYSSRLERLVDTEEFLRIKDFYGMHIIVTEIPKDFVSPNAALMANLRIRNDLKDKNSSMYKKYNQKCIEILSDDFIARLKGEGISEKYLAAHPNVAEKWNKYIESTKILPDSEKYKKKKNGYVADHIKFEMMRNKMRTFEMQITSKAVALISKGKGLAAHASRFGKERVAPSIVEDENKDLENLNDEDLKKFKYELDYYLPSYYQMIKNPETNEYECKKFSIYENCERFYEDFNDPENDNMHEQAMYNRTLYVVDKYYGEKEFPKKTQDDDGDIDI